jgi:HK97 family phage major capsid protein
MEFKTAITNVYPATNDQPLVAADRLAGIIANPNRRLRIRDLVPTYGTTSNLIEYAKENVFTNQAGPQYGTASPTQVENVLKNESGITFTLTNTPVITLAHNIPASRQVLDDAPMLEGYIRDRLIYGLNLEEEEEILAGTGTSGTLNGLINNATAVASSASGTDTKIDVIRRLMTALETSEFLAEAVVLNPLDWQDIELTKDADGRYIFANPQAVAQPRIWGLPVVSTNTMTSGQVLVGAFTQAAGLFDRMTLTVELFREHSDYAARNMVLLQAEKRLALAVWRPLALRKTTF